MVTDFVSSQFDENANALSESHSSGEVDVSQNQTENSLPDWTTPISQPLGMLRSSRASLNSACSDLPQAQRRPGLESNKASDCRPMEEATICAETLCEIDESGLTDDAAAKRTEDYQPIDNETSPTASRGRESSVRQSSPSSTCNVPKTIPRVSVVIPVHRPDTTDEHTKSHRLRYNLRQSVRSEIPRRNNQQVDGSSSSGDSSDDYIPESEVPAMTKKRTSTRQKRPVCRETSDEDGLKRRRVSAPALSTVNNHQQAASVLPDFVQESEPIPIQGSLTLRACGPDIFYRVDFSQSLIAKLAASQSDPTHIGFPPYTKDNERQFLKSVWFSSEENRQLVQLKESDKLTWNDIARHFPGRSKSSLQVQYAKLRTGRQMTAGKRRSRR